MSGVNLDAIYQRLQSIPRYHPMSANTFADWAMEAGDIVTVTRDGTGYASPVGTMTLKWNGKQQIQISTEGSRERDSISKVSARKYARGAGGSSGIRSDRELYWEMSSEDGLVHASIHATAESLTTDYSKRISDQNIELRGVITQTAVALTSDYTQKIGDVDAALRGTITQTAASLTSDYNNKIENTNSRITQTADTINTRIANLDTRLTTQIGETASTLSLAVGKVKYSNVQNYASKNNFPATGTAGVLYHANDTGIDYLYMPGTHSYEKAKTDEYGNANFIKAGEIAITINESGDAEAKLDAKVVYAGANTQQTLAGLDLPDWMDTTEGLIAEKATIVSLNALKARVGTLETDSLMTKDLSAEIGKLDYVSVKGLMVANDGVISFSGASGASINVDRFKDTVFALQIVQSGNNYTLQKKTMLTPGSWVDVGTFSRATSLSGAWSGGVYTVTASPQGNTRTIGFSSSANEYLVLYGKSGEYVYTNPSTGVADYHYLYKPTAVGTGNSSGPPTERHTDDLLVDATLSYDAGYDAGWSTARGKVSIPGQGSGSSITPAWPSATKNQQESRTYEFYSDSNNNVILRYNTAGSGQQPSYVTAASFNHGKYNAGWSAARGKVSIPGQGSGSSITPAWPSATTGEQESRTYEFYSDSNNNVILRYNTAGSGQQPSYVTAASFNHGKYNLGFDAVSAPSVTFTDLGATTIGDVSGRASISNKTDGSTRRTSISLALSKTTYTPSASVGAQNCVVVKTSGGTVVGRIDIGAGYDAGYVAGWNAARAKVTRSGDTIYRPKARTASDGSAARQTENEQAFIANYTASSHTNTRKTSAVGYYKIGTTGSSHDLDSSSSTSSYSMTFIPKADVTAGVYIYIRPSVSGSDSYTESSFSWTDK